MKEEIVITIDRNGEVSLQVQGVKGKSCLKTTEFLEQLLGTVQNRQFTQEYYQQEARNVGYDTLRRSG